METPKNNNKQSRDIGERAPSKNQPNHDTTTGRAAQRNQDEVDAQRGDNDDFTTNGLDQGNTMGNDDDVADAKESGTR